MKRTTLLLSALAVSSMAHAGTPAPAKAPTYVAPVAQESPWSFRFAPYGWLAAKDGDIAIGELSAPIDISMSDVLDDLDMAFMGIVEIGYNRWSLGVDFVYAKTSSNIDGGGRRFDSFRYSQKEWVISPTIAYRTIERENYFMDVFAGARVTALESALTGRFVGGGERRESSDIDWVDPIIGIRGQSGFAGNWFFRYNGDIGGFGASSDLVWSAFAGLGYNFSQNVGIALGYRGLGVDYTDGDFSIDTVSHGPVLGLEVRF